MSNVVNFGRRVAKGESRLIYIAAPFLARAEALSLKAELESAGHVVTSTWITSHMSEFEGMSEEEMGREAAHDAEGVGRCEILILLNNVGPSTSGGMHVELGLALAWGKQVLVVGEKTSIFHHLHAGIKVCDRDVVVDRVNRLFPRQMKKGGENG